MSISAREKITMYIYTSIWLLTIKIVTKLKSRGLNLFRIDMLLELESSLRFLLILIYRAIANKKLIDRASPI